VDLELFLQEHKVWGVTDLSPFQCFYKFFPFEIYDLVAKETNDHAMLCLDSTGKILEVKRSYSM
jgi:hypothetical protein